MLVWGPIYWNFLHTYCEFNPHLKFKTSQEFIAWFHSSIPCPKCKEHYLEFNRRYEHTEETTLEQWAFDLHNDVNAKLNKKKIYMGRIQKKTFKER